MCEKIWRCGRESNPRVAALQAAALPLGHRTSSRRRSTGWRRLSRHRETRSTILLHATTATRNPLNKTPNRCSVAPLLRACCGGCAGNRLVHYWGADQVAPLGPRAIIILHVVVAE